MAFLPREADLVIETNGRTVAEQIGAQIFIDGWAMVAPQNPQLAAKLAQKAGSVSHDGESVYAAMLWAAMEAEAFSSKDVDHLLDTGLSVIPPDSAIAILINDIRQWHASDQDWLKTRQRIEDKHGYDKYCGACHIMPNHGVMVMALLYAGHDFTEAMHIINTCGWDTDCNSGNIGCLVALMHGMDAFKGVTDWRGPLDDRALISSADGGYSITTAADIAAEVTNIGLRMAGQPPLPPPKDGARFHFTLPGSIQGFRAKSAAVAHGYDENGTGVLVITCGDLTPTDDAAEVLTDTFAGKDVLKMHTYPLMASPLVYPGQTLRARVKSPGSNQTSARVALRLKAYGPKDELLPRDGDAVDIDPGGEKTLEWTIPDDVDGHPIQSVGISVSTIKSNSTGKVILGSLAWTGVPRMTLKKPADGSSQFWMKAWVKGVDAFRPWGDASFCAVKNRGEGIATYGTREWTDYSVAAADFTVQFGQPSGVAIRVRGLNRYYALVLTGNGKKVSLIKALDEERLVLASAEFSWTLDQPYDLFIQASGTRIIGCIGGTEVRLTAEDGQYAGGGLGLVVTAGSVSVGRIHVGLVV